jgi:CheY-like chemotaxis protein
MEALKEGNVQCRVSLVLDGEEAMEFLHQEGIYAQAPRPDLILLDLKLPKKDGREVLGEIRADEQLQRIPVVILTASQIYRETLQRENLQVESCMIKPVDMVQFISVVKELRRFWMADIILPPLD